MAVSDHLKQASMELSKAAAAVKIEIDNLRREKENKRRDYRNIITQLRLRIQQSDSDQRRIDDPQQLTQNQATIAFLTRELANKESELKQFQRDIENAIHQKSGMVSGLESQARSIRP